MSQYIPYSIRHNITDKDLAGLLDYLERIMGWDISLTIEDGITYIEGIDGKLCKVVGFDDGEFQIYSDLFERLAMPKALFFRTYKTLLPVIRDLYSK